MHKHPLRLGSERPGHDIVVIGGSAGSIEALRSLLSRIPPDFQAAVFVVIHTAATGRYFLPQVLQRDTALELLAVEDKIPICYGQIYVARPDLHLLVEPEHIRVVFGPKENRLRPAIDPLFRSAALAHGSRVIGVLLSGALDDGVAGLWDVHCCGGITMVQDPLSAESPGLIQNALAAITVDHVAVPEKLAGLLTRFSRIPPKPAELLYAERERIELENSIETEPGDYAEALQRVGELSAYTCPGCGGPLWRLPDKAVERYRCRIGHAYSGTSLFQGCWEISERTLYAALQMLEENAGIGRRMLETAARSGHSAAPELLEQVLRLEREADTLRGLLAERTYRRPDSSPS